MISIDQDFKLSHMKNTPKLEFEDAYNFFIICLQDFCIQFQRNVHLIIQAKVEISINFI